MMRIAYLQSKEEQRRLHKKAIDLLDAMQANYNPINYGLAYEYFIGGNAPFVKAVDKLRANNEQLSDMLAIRLNEQYFKAQEREIMLCEQELETLVNAITEQASERANETLVLADDLEKYPEDALQIAAKTRRAIRGLQHTLKTTDQNFKAVRARLKEFKKATMTDMVTRLSNDIHLQNVLPEMVNRYRNNEDSQIILALIDIEGFGQYNMTYGHELADNLLRTCAKHIVNLGGKYLGWRIGADEFLIATLAKNSEVDHVMSALESLKTRLSKIRLQSKTKATITEPVDIKMIAKPLNLAWGVTDNINHLYIEMRKSQSAEES